jgi:hypothetical protein
MFVLDSRGKVVHEFHGLPGVGRSEARGRSDHKAEIRKARGILKLPEAEREHPDGPLPGLPDLKPLDSGAPGGVRLFIRQDDPANSIRSRLPVVEVVSMTADDWKPLAYPANKRDIEAATLKSWLVWLYPAGIRAADEQKRFQRFDGTLTLEPAGSDDNFRYALLRGRVRLAKGGDTESAFEGELKALLTYRREAAEVRSLRGVVEGTYLYRTRGTSREKLSVAIESRP